jgi:S1-C subfamily serine protease
VELSRARPDDGSLVLYLAPNDGSGRLGLWTGGSSDAGIVYSTDGRVAGIARYGQFLSGSACRLIADQIIRHGSVKRATLGVIISEIRQDDPLRQQTPVLGTRTAMRVDQVMSGSAAERAGLRQGDLLLALAGESVSDIPSLAAAIAARSGQTRLQVLRDGRIIEIAVDLQPK